MRLASASALAENEAEADETPPTTFGCLWWPVLLLSLLLAGGSANELRQRDGFVRIADLVEHRARLVGAEIEHTRAKTSGPSALHSRPTSQRTFSNNSSPTVIRGQDSWRLKLELEGKPRLLESRPGEEREDWKTLVAEVPPGSEVTVKLFGPALRDGRPEPLTVYGIRSGEKEYDGYDQTRLYGEVWLWIVAMWILVIGGGLVALVCLLLVAWDRRRVARWRAERAGAGD